MIRVEELLNRLGEEESLAALKMEWDLSQAAYPAGGPDFLRPEQVRVNMLACGFGDEDIARALPVAARLQADPLLAALTWHIAWRIFESDDDHWFAGWPRLEKALGENAGMPFLLAGVALVPRVQAHHAQMGIEPAVTEETLRQTHHFSRNYAESYPGRLGIHTPPSIWLRHYTREKYFRLGRFEFWLKRWDGETRVFRSRLSGQVLALAPAGERFDAQGYMPVEEEPVQPGEWRSILEEGAGWVRGNPVSPLGHGLPEPVKLDLAEWQPALCKGDWVLDMHIPAGGGMEPEAVHASWRRAAEFFPRHFPETLPKAYVCWSWIYNPNLGEILPPGSNLVRNIQEAYLLPVASSPDDGLSFFFYQDRFDPLTAPRKTSLQRAVLAYLERGGRWRCGAMFYLMDDLDKLGQRHYQRQALTSGAS
jgi:hypothetical protein